MIGRRSTISLALLCAFAFSAFAAQSATAQVGTKSINTTAVTCEKGGGTLDFEDSHCKTKVASETGKFGHVSITKGTKTELKDELEGTAKLNATLAGVATEITCKKVESVAGKSFLENEESEGKHTVKGTAQVSFTECTVNKPSKCTIKEPLVVTAEAVGVEGLNGKNEMGVEFVGKGAEKTLSELFFQNKGEEKCSLTNGGKAFLIKGSAISTGAVAQGNEHSSATGVYEDANEMQTLEIGLKKASFAATITTGMDGIGGNAIAGTTIT